MLSLCIAVANVVCVYHRDKRRFWRSSKGVKSLSLLPLTMYSITPVAIKNSACCRQWSPFTYWCYLFIFVWKTWKCWV